MKELPAFIKEPVKNWQFYWWLFDLFKRTEYCDYICNPTVNLWVFVLRIAVMNPKNHLDHQSLQVLFLIFQLKACMYIKLIFNYGYSHVSFGNIGGKNSSQWWRQSFHNCPTLIFMLNLWYNVSPFDQRR